MTTMGTTIYVSAYKGDYDLVKSKVDGDPALVDQKDDDGRILLHWAAISGNIKLVTYLIESNSDVGACDDTETTPLVLAASSGKLEIVKLLLANGANVNHKTTQGHSALQYAASKDYLDICRHLVENDADINIADIRGATPLHRAASKGNLSVVKYLLSFKDKIDVNARDAYGNTALHLACDEDRQDEAKLLLGAGARADIKNKEEKTALDLCTRGLARIIEHSKASASQQENTIEESDDKQLFGRVISQRITYRDRQQISYA